MQVSGDILATQVKAGSGSFGFVAAADTWTGFDVTGLNKRIILGVTGGQTRNVFDIERTDTWEHLMELRANGSAYFKNNVRIEPPSLVEGLVIKSSDYSPFVIRNTANTVDLFRINETGLIIGNPLAFKSTGNIIFTTDNSDVMKARLGVIGTETIFDVPEKIRTNRIETESIQHTETVLQPVINYTYGGDNCWSCNDPGITVNTDLNLLERLAKYSKDFFIIPIANALPVCYHSCNPYDAPACSTLPGGSAVWTDLNQNLTTSVSVPTGCLANGLCANTMLYYSYIYRRTCQKDDASISTVSKIDFGGSPAAGLPGVTKVKDNLVVEQNRWGDGVTSNCAWKNASPGGTWCPLGQYVAGFDPTGPRMYCCDL